jgi:hypothetical protein
MSVRSRYDQLHDKFWHTPTSKAGTRYERLAAFVLKALNEKNAVIHDLRLIGESEVKHQIDIIIIESGKERRFLVECKDFDVRGAKVGLSVIRDFWGVIDDIHPDEAIIITCNGFTRDARKYAKNKGIKLAVLREFGESDWDDRIKTIRVTMYIMHVTEPKVSVHVSKQEYIDKFQQDLQSLGITGFGIWKGQPVYLNLPGGRIQLCEFIGKNLNEYPRENPGQVILRIPFKDTTLEVDGRGGVPIEGIVMEFEIIHSDDYFDITSNKVARLILEGFEDKDLIIFEEDLKRLTIDPETGEIVV